MRVWAEQWPLDLKYSLKRRGYRWSDGSDGRLRSWCVDVDESRLDDEIAFLKNEIYLRDVEPRLQTLTAFAANSSRPDKDAIDPVYGPAVRCKRFLSSWHSTVLHQCIRSLIGAGLLRTIIDISARAFSLADRPHAHVKDNIHCEEHGNIRVRGIADPVTTYRVVDLKANLASGGGAVVTLPHLRLELEPHLMSAEDRDEAAATLRQALGQLSR